MTYFLNGPLTSFCSSIEYDLNQQHRTPPPVTYFLNGPLTSSCSSIEYDLNQQHRTRTAFTREQLNQLEKVGSILITVIQSTLGAIQKLRHSPRGGGGWAKRWLSVTRGEGVSQKSDVTHPKNFICSFSSFCSLKVCQIHNFIQFLCYCSCFWWKSSKISDQIIALERLFFINFQDQSLSLFGEWHGGEGGRDKRWQSVTRGGGGSKIAILGVTSFLNGPQVTQSHIQKMLLYINNFRIKLYD